MKKINIREMRVHASRSTLQRFPAIIPSDRNSELIEIAKAIIAHLITASQEARVFSPAKE